MSELTISRISTADHVAAILRVKILNGEFLPGSNFPEVSLAEALGVSRNTMREALRILSLEGLVKRSLHRGTTVAQLSLVDIEDIYSLRRLCEIPAIFAAAKASALPLNEMHEVLQECERAVKETEWARAIEKDFVFHTLLVSIHGSRRLTVFFEKVIRELALGMVFVGRAHADPERVNHQHRQIYNLLKARDYQKCASILTAHINESENRLKSVYQASLSTKTP